VFLFNLVGIMTLGARVRSSSRPRSGPLPQAYARPADILVDKLDAGTFESAPNNIESLTTWRRERAAAGRPRLGRVEIRAVLIEPWSAVALGARRFRRRRLL
jgi:hypothetical protein